jgi:uncharacterized membrane protein
MVRLHTALLCLVVAAGAALRIHDLGTESYWIDEVSMLNAAGGDVETIAADFREGGRPPVYVWLGRGWMSVFGTSEAATRSLSAVFGIAAIVALYLIGRELFGRWVGLIAAALLTVSRFHIYQAQNFRYYSLMLFLTLVSFFFFHRALKSGRSGYFAGWVAAGLLLFYTHYFAVFAFAAQTLYSLFVLRGTRSLLTPWLVSQAVLYAAPAVQLLLPILAKVAANEEPAFGPVWIPPQPSPAIMLTTIREYLFAGVPVMRLLLIGCVLGAVLILYWTVKGGSALRRSLYETIGELRGVAGKGSELAMVMCWFVWPIVIPFVLSLALRPMYVHRYTIAAAPALYLLVACAAWSVRRLIPPMLALGLFAAAIVPPLYAYYARPYNEQWREVAAHVASAALPGDAMMIAPARFDEGWYWYFRGDLPQCSRGEEFSGAQAFLGAVERCAAGEKRVWVVLRNTSLVAGFNKELADLLAARPGMERHDYHLLRLYLMRPGTRQPRPRASARVRSSDEQSLTLR